MSHHDYSLEELQDITPFENYITAIRDKVTTKKYAGQLEMFLNPDYDWDKSQQKRKLLPEKEFAILVNNFVSLIKKDPNAGKNKIKRYVMVLKKQIDEKKLNPNTSRNRLKPIKTLLRANEVDFSWYLIDRMMPKETKSEDRAYTRVEIQKMIVHCEDITDKVIIIGFSAAGFRLEAWDYFTWSDVVFFRNDDTAPYKGVRGKATATIIQDVNSSLPILEKLLNKYTGSLDNKMAKFLFNSVKSGESVVIEITPHFFATWDHSKGSMQQN